MNACLAAALRVMCLFSPRAAPRAVDLVPFFRVYVFQWAVLPCAVFCPVAAGRLERFEPELLASTAEEPTTNRHIARTRASRRNMPRLREIPKRLSNRGVVSCGVP